MPDVVSSFVSLSPVPSVAKVSGSVLPEICVRPMFKLTEVGSVKKLNSIKKKNLAKTFGSKKKSNHASTDLASKFCPLAPTFAQILLIIHGGRYSPFTSTTQQLV